MTGAGAGVQDVTVGSQKLPSVAIAGEVQLQDAVGGDPHLALRRRDPERIELGAAGADDELAQAVGSGTAIRVEREEALVQVVVTVDYDLGPGLLQELPDIPHDRGR